MARPLTGQSSTLKRINVALVKDALRAKGTATRKEISEATHLSQPTVNTIISMLRQENEVVCRGTAMSSGGRRAEIYALNHEHRQVAAVFATPDHLDYAVTDSRGSVMFHDTVQVSRERDYCDQLYVLLQRLVDNYPNIRVAGVTFPTAVGVLGDLFAATQVPELEGTNPQQSLEKRLSVPIIVENDVKLRALGYYRAELMRQTESMAYLHLSSGLGSGVILGGHVHCGATNFSGEINYMLSGEKWAGKTIEDILALVEDEDELAEILTQLAMCLICVVNPPFLAMGGSRITASIVEKVSGTCVQKLPKGVAPHFLYVADETRYLYAGIAGFAQEQIDAELRIVRTGEA